MNEIHLTPIILHDSNTWDTLSCGITGEPKTLTHLASLTKGVETANGWSPKQIPNWIDTDMLRQAGVKL